MRVYKRDKKKISVPAVDGAVRRHEVESDVLEIWIVASRLLGRLTDSSRPLLGRKAQRRSRNIRAVKTVAPRSALTP